MAVKSPIRLNDIAEAAQTSIATVSMALSGDPRISEETRRRVQHLSRQLGYRRRRASQRTVRRLGAEIGSRRFAFLAMDRMDAPAHTLLIQALSEQAASHDVRIEISSLPTGLPPDAVTDRALQLGRTVDGLILMGSIQVEQLRQIDQAGIPAVMYGYPVSAPDEENPPVPIVTSDWVSMGHRATRALIELDHKRIGFISGWFVPNAWHARCFDGYACALLHAGVPLDQSIVFVGKREDEYCGTTAAGVFRAMKQRPTAYVAVNAGTAGRFVQAMREAGIDVPTRDLVVCGYPHLMHEFGLDDYPLVYMDPAKIVAAAITQLRAKCMHRTGGNVTVLVPFSSKNLPTSAS